MLRGFSADSLSRAEDRLGELTQRSDPERLGSELFAVEEVLGHQGSLRRALTDPSADNSAKTALVRSVFAGRVSDETVDLLDTTVTARWSSSADFLDGLERLGALAYVVSAENNGGIDDLEDELFRFGRIVAASPQLRDALTNPQVPVGYRQELVESLLNGKASTATIRLVQQAIASRERVFESALETYQRIAAARQQRMVAVVRTSITLTDAEQQRLSQALRRIYRRQVHLNVVVEPALLGGMRIELGDDIIDGTVLTRLQEARRRMTT
jgi:F-type H+-transporting ATPase subunit delta